ncbi:MAG: PKD domain-containing protein [Psychrosphaera sp.]|nr:PKD domain-containing protein [Psychrosphaera sp.]
MDCTFDASASADAEGVITSYEWDFSDGTAATGLNPSYVFADIGQYTVTLTVTDEAGESTQLTMDLIIDEQRFFENADSTEIKDKGKTKSYMMVERTVDTNTVDVHVDITHEYRGHVKLVLVAPDGTRYKMKKFNRKDDAQDINETYSVDFEGVAQGEWKLVIKDKRTNSLGQLNSWSLQF